MSEDEERGDRYRRRLLLLLSSATFFEGYDNFALAFVLALVLGDLGGSEADAGWIRAITPLGAVVAFGLAAQADRVGRKRLLLITIVGYTVSAALTAVSPGLLWLTAAQFSAQVFLGAEWAVAITIVVEEFPRTHRGRALGIVTSMNTLGGIFVGVLAFIGLQDTALGWRAFFVVASCRCSSSRGVVARCSRPSATRRFGATSGARGWITPRSSSPGDRPTGAWSWPSAS